MSDASTHATPLASHTDTFPWQLRIGAQRRTGSDRIGHLLEMLEMLEMHSYRPTNRPISASARLLSRSPGLLYTVLESAFVVPATL
jgi:hypothetical protein